jgi:hypothetical protein
MSVSASWEVSVRAMVAISALSASSNNLRSSSTLASAGARWCIRLAIARAWSTKAEFTSVSTRCGDRSCVAARCRDGRRGRLAKAAPFSVKHYHRGRHDHGGAGAEPEVDDGAVLLGEAREPHDLQTL